MKKPTKDELSIDSLIKRISLRSLSPDDRVAIAQAIDMVRHGKAASVREAFHVTDSSGKWRPVIEPLGALRDEMQAISEDRTRIRSVRECCSSVGFKLSKIIHDTLALK